MKWERAIWSKPWRIKGLILALALLLLAMPVVALVAVSTGWGTG